MPLRLQPYAIRLSAPLQTAQGTIDWRSGTLLVAGDALGEAAPLAGWTETPIACRIALRNAATAIAAGEWDGAVERATATPAARHAVSLARADRSAREADEPLATHLATGPVPSSVPVNATVGDGPVEATADRAVAAVERGFDCVKVKVGNRPVTEDLERMRAVRNRVGGAVALRADANGAWDRASARQFLEGARGLELSLLEQPLDPTDLLGLAGLRGSGVPIGVDESLALGAPGATAVLEADAADVLVIKPMAQGGVDRVVRLVDRCRAAGLGWVITTTVDAVVARTAAVHVAAALDPDRACGLATADRLRRDLGPDPVSIRVGRAVVPDTAGIGVTLGGRST